MNILLLLTIALTVLTAWTAAAHPRISLLQPPLGKTEMALSIPPFRSFCWFAAERGRWPGDGNRILPWFGRMNAKGLLDSTPNPITTHPGSRAMFALFHLTDGRYMAVLPVAEPGSLAWLQLDGEGTFMLKSGTLGPASATPRSVLAVTAVDNGVYRACSAVWEKALSLPFIKGRTGSRAEKTYPEPFKYLGWCSWEQYKKNISSPLLEQTARQLEESPVPVRWMLVDDGFQTQEGLKLISFQPRKDKFPKGWQPLMKHKSAKLKWIGLWHCYYGLWNGIHPEHRLGARAARGLVATPRGTLLPGDGPGGAAAFYQPFLQSVKDAGFDFVKIDVQAEYLKHADGLDNPVHHNTQCAEALEQACRRTELALINCMAQGTVNIQNTRYSAVTRCSIDYKLGDAAMGKSHILQSYANTLWLGQTVWPALDVEITGFQDRLFILAPIVRGWAVIGRGDKFLSACAVEGTPEYAADTLHFRVKESGPLVVWRGNGTVKAGTAPVRNLGNGFYELQFPVSPRPLDVTVTAE